MLYLGKVHCELLKLRSGIRQDGIRIRVRVRVRSGWFGTRRDAMLLSQSSRLGTLGDEPPRSPRRQAEGEACSYLYMPCTHVCMLCVCMCTCICTCHHAARLMAKPAPIPPKAETAKDMAESQRHVYTCTCTCTKPGRGSKRTVNR